MPLYEVGGQKYDARNVDEAIAEARRDPKNTKVGPSATERSAPQRQAWEERMGTPARTAPTVTAARSPNILRDTGIVTDAGTTNVNGKPSLGGDSSREGSGNIIVKTMDNPSGDPANVVTPPTPTRTESSRETADRLAKGLDQSWNPTVGWDNLALDLNVAPEAVTEAKRILEDTLKRAPNVGRTTDRLLSGEFWNNNEVQSLAKKLAYDPKGKRWEGDVGAVLNYVGSRQQGTGVQQRNINIQSFRKPGIPGRHPTHTYDAYDAAVAAGRSTAGLESPPGSHQRGDWNIPEPQLAQMYPNRDPNALTSSFGLGQDPFTRTGQNVFSGYDTSDSTFFNPPVGDSLSTASNIWSNYNPAFNLGSMAGLNTALDTGTFNITPEPLGSNIMANTWWQNPGGYQDPGGSPREIPGTGRDLGGQPGNRPGSFGSFPHEWGDLFSGVMGNLIPGADIFGRRAASQQYYPLRSQYIMGAGLGRLPYNAQEFPSFLQSRLGIGGQTPGSSAAPGSYMTGGEPVFGGGGASGSRGFQLPAVFGTGSTGAPGSLGLQDLLRGTANLLTQDPMTPMSPSQVVLSDYLTHPMEGRNRQIELAINSAQNAIPSWLRGNFRDSALQRINERTARGEVGQFGILPSFVSGWGGDASGAFKF